MDAFAYFPSIVYRDERPEWVDYTKQVVQRYYDAAPQGGDILQTHQMASDPDLKFLVDYILASSVDILRSQGYDVDKYEFSVSALWGQDVKCNGGTNVHVHKNSQICGWFFLETPEGGSYPVYYDPRIQKQMIELDFAQSKEVTNATASVHFNNLKPGTVLMANSWLQHQLTQNVSQVETKSMHFIVSHREYVCSTC
jgi:uncharacterized protein (TIGR02466 family)